MAESRIKVVGVGFVKKCVASAALRRPTIRCTGAERAALRLPLPRERRRWASQISGSWIAWVISGMVAESQNKEEAHG